ncbi:MAG: preprotein translocase subunit SecG [Lachnospiraceae bacterium]|nr:preprotein translocase subunit SecG [Lachnospiraceae bacterium]
MSVLRIVLTVLLILVSVALVVLVLLQEGKDANLGAISGAYETFWSKNKGRSKEALLVRITEFLAVAFFVLSIVLNINAI